MAILVVFLCFALLYFVRVIRAIFCVFPIHYDPKEVLELHAPASSTKRPI
jgi:hypothetical protein